MLLGISEEPKEPSASNPPIDPTRLAGRYVHGPDSFTLTATPDGVKYRFRDSEAAAVKGPERMGRVTGNIYLTDGLSAFRKR